MKLPQKAKELLESMARTIESLTAQLRRRGVVFDEDEEDMTGYHEYREHHPREDA